MKTNLSSLMGIVSDIERENSDAYYNIGKYAYNASIQELDGTVTVIEDYKEDFDETLLKCEENLKKIIKIKSAIYQKNNEFKLNDGRTIQEAIVENMHLRKLKNSYKQLLLNKSSKRRETEVNNSYFECRDLNYDIKDIRAKYEALEKKIQDTDFEISKLNSIEFEIDI